MRDFVLGVSCSNKLVLIQFSSSLPVMCGGNLMVPGSIMSPGFPGNYPANLSCVWTLANLPEDSILRFGFRSFALADAG